MATVKILQSAVYRLSLARRISPTNLTIQHSRLNTNNLRNARPVAHLHTCRQRFSKNESSQPSRLQKNSLVLAKTLFEQANEEQTNGETFKQVIKAFTEYDKRRRGHLQFIETALRNMNNFKVEKDIDAYNTILDIFPKGKYVAENVLQQIYNHYPEQQICAIKVLQMMEDNTVLPNADTKDILLAVFGKGSHPVKKYQRLMYWFPKFRNINPFPLPKELPSDSVSLAKLALKRIAEYEAELQVFYLNNTSELSPSPDFITNVQSPEQQELLAEHPPLRPLYVEGAFHLWLRSTKLTYFVLRGDPFALGDEEPEEDVPQLHAEGPVFAMCVTNSNTQETLKTWIKNLQKDNAHLARIPVIFNLFNLGNESDSETVVNFESGGSSTKLLKET